MTLALIESPRLTYEGDVLPRMQRMRKIIRERLPHSHAIAPTKVPWQFRDMTTDRSVAAHALATLDEIERGTSPSDRADRIAGSDTVLAALIRIHTLEYMLLNFKVYSIREIEKP